MEIKYQKGPQSCSEIDSQKDESMQKCLCSPSIEILIYWLGGGGEVEDGLASWGPSWSLSIPPVGNRVH